MFNYRLTGARLGRLVGPSRAICHKHGEVFGATYRHGAAQRPTDRKHRGSTADGAARLSVIFIGPYPCSAE